MAWSDRVNDYVATSRVGKYFQLEGSGHRRERRGTKFLTEIRAGLTTFFAMVNNQLDSRNQKKKKKKKKNVITFSKL
jgi:hypothetical protein